MTSFTGNSAHLGAIYVEYRLFCLQSESGAIAVETGSPARCAPGFKGGIQERIKGSYYQHWLFDFDSSGFLAVSENCRPAFFLRALI